MIIRLDTGEEIKIIDYYMNWVNKGSYKSLRKKYDILKTDYGCVFTTIACQYDNVIPNHLWEIIEVK